MKKVFLLGCMVWSLTFCTQKKEPVVVTVGDYTVGLKAYKQRVQTYLEHSVAKDNLIVRKQVAQNMAHEILLRYYDDNRAIDENSEYKKEQAWAHKEMVLGYLKDQQVYAKISVTDAEVRKAYKRSREKIAARHLYAPTLERAKELYKKLHAGASWDSLASEVFTDSTLRHNGGFLGYFSGGDMDPAFEDTAFALKVGVISQPVKTAHGYSIIRVEDKKPFPVITENEYLNRKQAQERLLKISKKAVYEKKFIESVFDKQALSFNQQGMTTLLGYLQPLSGNSESLPHKQQVLSYKELTWNVDDALAKIGEIPAFHRPQIHNIAGLEAVLKSLLVQSALLEKAKEFGYDQAADVLRAENNAKMHIFLKYKIKEVLNNYTVPDSTLKKYYDTHIEAFNKPRKLNVKEILAETFNAVLPLKARLLKGESFGELAKKYSLRKWSANRNGEIGLSDWKRFGMLKNRFWKAPLNQVIGPVKTSSFYGLFKVIKKVEAQPAAFLDVREKVVRMYEKENEQSIVFAYLGKIYKKVNVTYNEKLIRFFNLDPQ